MRADIWIRAARRTRRVSQRKLASLTGVPSGTVGRIESGANSPRVDTFVLLLAALGYQLRIVDGRGRLLEVDEEHERLLDRAGRHFPAHLVWRETGDYFAGDWWGWHRIAWMGDERNEAVVPRYTFDRPRPRDQHVVGSVPPEWIAVWDDAT